MLAEDNKINRIFISHFLSEAGHTVIQVSDGEEALSAMETTAFDIILMDVQMPGMNGLEATQQIRSGTQCPDIPIIALTAYAMKGDKEKFLAAGMDDYVSKPVNINELKAVIARAAGSQHTVISSDRKDTQLNTEMKILDKAAALRRFQGNRLLLEECYGLFMEEIEKRKDIFRKAYAESDFDELEFQAHFMKGISRNLGAESCHVFAEKLEFAAGEKNPNHIQNYYPVFEHAMMKVHSVLKESVTPGNNHQGFLNEYLSPSEEKFETAA